MTKPPDLDAVDDGEVHFLGHFEQPPSRSRVFTPELLDSISLEQLQYMTPAQFCTLSPQEFCYLPAEHRHYILSTCRNSRYEDALWWATTLLVHLRRLQHERCRLGQELFDASRNNADNQNQFPYPQPSASSSPRSLSRFTHSSSMAMNSDPPGNCKWVYFCAFCAEQLDYGRKGLPTLTELQLSHYGDDPGAICSDASRKKLKQLKLERRVPEDCDNTMATEHVTRKICCALESCNQLLEPSQVQVHMLKCRNMWEPAVPPAPNGTYLSVMQPPQRETFNGYIPGKSDVSPWQLSSRELQGQSIYAPAPILGHTGLVLKDQFMVTPDHVDVATIAMKASESPVSWRLEQHEIIRGENTSVGAVLPEAVSTTTSFLSVTEEIPRTEIYADISPPSTPPARGTPDEAFADMHSINAQSTLSAARTDHNSSICDVVAENHHSEERSSHQSVDCGGHLTGVQAGEEDGFLFQLLEGISEGSTVERAPQEISGCGNSDLRHPGRVLQKAAKATSGVSVPASSVEVCSENNSEVTAKTCDLVTMVDRTVLRGRDRKKFQSQPISPLKKNVVPPRQPPAKKPKAKKKTAKCGKMQKMRHQFNLSTGVGCRKRKLLESLEWTDTESSPEKKGSSGKDHVYVGVAGLAEGMIRFICKCGHPFSDDRSLDAHSKRHVNHPTQEQMKLLCPREKCGYVGLDVADFTRHVARHILMLHALGHPQKEEDSIE